MTVDNDIDSIFEKNSINEIDKLLSKTRNDIEKKKEDLRIMVGERYRDLIEAADTIASMQKSANSICMNISNMESLCQSLKQTGLIGFKTRTLDNEVSSRLHTSEHQYSIAVQIKLLVDVPEILWGLTESKDFLKAAQLFLLSQHAHTALHLSSSANKALEAFPVISRQWSNISQFRSTIVKGCEKKIKTELSDYQSVLDCVLAIVLLEGGSLHKMLLRVLELRKISVKASLETGHSTTAKKQLNDFIMLLISSLEILHFLFQRKESSGLCSTEEKLKSISGDIPGEENSLPLSLLNETSLALNFLPKSVLEFRPKVYGDFQTLNADLVEKEIKTWLKDILQHSETSITELLSYTTSIKALSMIRDNIWQLQASSIDISHWKIVTNQLLRRESFTPWQAVIKDRVLERCKALVSKELNNTKNIIFKLIENLVKEVIKDPRYCSEEGDLTAFVWGETPSDLPDQIGWITASNRSATDQKEKTGLFYKSRGYTKRVQAICRALNNKLTILMEDIFYYAPDSFKSANLQKDTSSADEQSALEDYSALLLFLEKQTLNVFTEHMIELKSLAEKLDDNEKVESVTDDLNAQNRCSMNSTKLVIISRLCQAFSVVCPQLKLCAGASLLGNPDSVRRVNLGVQQDTETWINLRTELLDYSTVLMTKFMSFVTDAVAKEFKNNFVQKISSEKAEDLLMVFSSWDAVGIEEEGEGGKVVQSSISVPSSPSPSLSQALMEVGSWINCVSAHTITKKSQQELVSQLCLHLISAYEEIEASNQTSALQLIFDLKLIKLLFVSRDSKDLVDRITVRIQKLETKVDPFDLDVFQPHITTRVKVAATRLQLLVGILLPRDRQHLKGAQISSSIHSNNSLPIVPSMDIPRFSNVPLPISSSTRSSRTSSIMDNINTASSFTSGMGSDKFLKSSYKNTAKDTMDSSVSGSSRSAAASLISSWFGGAS